MSRGRVRTVILGAAGRDFHNFNVVYRDDPATEVIAFTAAQIPDIAGRRYPPALAGPLYPQGIPIVAESQRGLGGAPTLIGEFGLPFDLDDGAAYQSLDFTPHIEALTAHYDALDANLVHSAQWNYTADNSNTRGDQWNDKDLSLFSRDQTSINPGGRALKAAVRPYASKIETIDQLLKKISPHVFISCFHGNKLVLKD